MNNKRVLLSSFNNFRVNESKIRTYTENQKIIRSYLKNLKNSVKFINTNTIDEQGNTCNPNDLWVDFLIVLHNYLHVEEKFINEVKMSNKQINCHLDLMKTSDFDEIINICQEYYDQYNVVRFAVETLDSIEEVRLYIDTLMKNGINIYNKIYVNINEKY